MSQDDYQPNTSFALFPPAIKNLIIINLIVLLAQNTPILDRLLFRFFALWPIETGLFLPWQLVSYMFMHGGFTHILFNLIALWMFGQVLENIWGTRRFMMYYFITGIGAGILQLLIGGGGPVVGASGAVFGILLAFGMTFPDRYIFLLFPPIPIKAKYFVIFYAVTELLYGVTNLTSGIAHFAHLGGMIAGYVLLRFWRQQRY